MKKKKSRVRNFAQRINKSLVRKTAWIIIIFLMIIDFMTVRDMFTAASVQNMTSAKSILYSISFAFALELFPTYLGIFSTMMLDRTRYQRNDIRIAKIGFAVCLVLSLFVIGLVISMRGIQIYAKGSYAAYKNSLETKNSSTEFTMDTFGTQDVNVVVVDTTQKYPEFLMDLFLMFSPALTSTLAFIVSWNGLRGDSIYKMEKETEQSYEQYMMDQEAFLEAFTKLQNKRIVAWNSVNSGVPMPKQHAVYGEEYCNYAKNKIIIDVIEAYNGGMIQYQESVEAELQKCLLELSKRSNVAHMIVSMNLNDIITEFDKSQDNSQKIPWTYELAKLRLETNLKNMLDRELIVSQKGTVSK